MSRRWKRMAHPRATTTNSIDGIVSPKRENDTIVSNRICGTALCFLFPFPPKTNPRKKNRVGSRGRERDGIKQ